MKSAAQNLYLGLCCLVFLTLTPAPADAEALSPRDRVGALNAALLDVMQNADSLGYEGRFNRLNPLLSELFDFKLMGRIAVGAYWKALDQSQRDQLIDAFGHLSIATFAARFNGYSGETFEVVSAEKSIRNTILVKTRLIKSNGEPVALNYLTRQSAGVWRIIDIFLDARFSELARLRADYTSVMRREGFEVLLKTIKSRITEYSEPREG
ncbi:MAG: ABC transporter substrate-binding protein [Alphaproteobacteria bacterium]|nr:ABC transporter substrate-binding protein [Alphaproteobacteria bacterium]